ncbi:MAG: hypothetical protein AAF798_13715 [Bacteroidota bacterium]
MKTRLFILLLIITFFAQCADVLVPDISEEEIMLISPGDSLQTLERSLSFTWEELEDATSYELQIVTPSFDAINTVVMDTITESTFISLDLNPGVYEWQVIGVNEAFSTTCCDSYQFIILEGDNEDVSNSVIELVAPADGACQMDTSLTFSWEALSGATQYVFQLASSTTFATILEAKELTTTTTSTTLDDEGTYYWRVRAENDFTQTFSDWRTRNFTLDRTAPTVPELTFPLDMDTLFVDMQETDLVWDSSTDAVEDELAIYDILGADTPIYSLVTTDFSIDLDTISINLPEGSYFWSVSSIDKAGNQSEEATTRSFFLKLE